ncbi:hypothetical protein Tco_1405302 [Tanacetum coccineum]
MTRNLKLLTNFVEKFLGTVKFGNDQIAPILGYGDLVQGTITIKRVYYVEGLNHNSFSIGQFCDADLEVAFRKSTSQNCLKWHQIHVSLTPGLQCSTTILEQDSLSPGPQSPENVPQVAETVTTSNELELLYSSMFSELLNGTSDVVSKSSAVHAADNPDKRQQHNTTHTSTTTDVADPPLLNIHSTHQTLTQVPTVTAPENIIQAETNTENAQFDEDEFINIFSTPVQEQGETSSRHVDSSNMHTFYQHHPSAQRWTKDHPLEQVIGNPSQSVRTRRQLETDGEMCMFALTVSRTKPKNIKEAMADSAWIESMQEELHQFDRLDLRDMPKGKELKSRDLLPSSLLGWKLYDCSLPKYAQEILKKHAMTSCDSIGTLMATKHLNADLSGTPVDQTKYRSMVGALMHLTASRPDILHAIYYCARYQAKPTEKHLTAVKQIFRYLKDSINMGLCSMLRNSGSQIYRFQFDNIPMYYDSKAAIDKNPSRVQSSPTFRTKHIDVKLSFIKEQVDKELLILKKVVMDTVLHMHNPSQTIRVSLKSNLSSFVMEIQRYPIDFSLTSLLILNYVAAVPGLSQSYALSWKPCQGDSLNLPDHRAQVDQGSQIKMIQVKEMMQDNDLKNLKSKDKGSKSRSQSMDEQSHYKQDKTITRQSINVKRHIFNVIGDTEKFEERDLNIGGDC